MKRLEKDVYTAVDIKEQLSAMAATQDSIVLVHSSLRLVGNVEGGAQTLLDALVDYFTAKGGLLAIPTHTWRNLKRDITLDMTSTENCLGALSTVALEDGRGIRSQNPTHSVVVFGNRERALKMIKDELWVSSGTAPNSFYGRLYDEGGYVLLLGVAHNRNTYLHCVDEMLGIPNRLTEEPREVKVRLASGEIVTSRMRTHKTDYTPDVSQRFVKYETAFRYHGCITDGFIGDAPTQLCDARRMRDTMALILKRSEGTDPLADESHIPPLRYCKRENKEGEKA